MGKITQQEALELIKNPRWFIENYFQIIGKSVSKIPLILNPPQDKYYRERTHNDLILKSRKEGFSTIIEALFLYDCLFFKYQRAVTLAQRDEEKNVHAERVKFFLANLGIDGMPFSVNVGKSNESGIHFPDTDSYYWFGSAGSVTFGRSRDITHFHGTEVTHYPSGEVLTGALNACVPGAWQVLETTANGLGDVFQLLWDDAGSGQSVWKRHFFAWFEDPTNQIDVPEGFNLSQKERDLMAAHGLNLRQMAWRRWKYGQQSDKSKFAQEYPATPEEAFLSSGRHIFNLGNLKRMLKKCVDPEWVGVLRPRMNGVDFVDQEEGALEVWGKPKRGSSYLVTADVAEGVPNGCYSVAAVYEVDSLNTRKVVAQYRARINPALFGRELALLAEYYNNALLVPERNNHGHATILAIQNEGYPVVESKEIMGEGDGYGFPTNIRTKELLIASLAEAIEDESYIEPSRTAIIEMMRMIRTATGQIEAESGYSDCVITRGIAEFSLKFLSLYGNDKKPLVMQKIAGGYNG